MGLTFGGAAAAAAFAEAKAWLGYRIAGGSGAIRRAVITVQYLMAWLGALLTLLSANLDGGTLPFLACLVGGSLSLAAASTLTRPPARDTWCQGTAVRPTAANSAAHSQSAAISQQLLPRIDHALKNARAPLASAGARAVSGSGSASRQRESARRTSRHVPGSSTAATAALIASPARNGVRPSAIDLASPTCR